MLRDACNASMLLSPQAHVLGAIPCHGQRACSPTSTNFRQGVGGGGGGLGGRGGEGGGSGGVGGLGGGEGHAKVGSVNVTT